MIDWRKFRSRLRAPAALVLFLFFRGIEALAAGAAPAKKLVNIADTRNLEPGLSKWIADLYNTSYLQFGLVVVATMAIMGLVLGLFCDRLVGLLGLNLGKMHHHE
jgi:hypothetical protein